MIKRRQAEGFNLAFLDIMSCGLGAIILVFMLVKHNVDNSSIELDHLKNDIQQLEQKKQTAEQTLKNIEAQLAENTAQESTAKKELTNKQSTLEKSNSETTTAAKELEALKSDIKNIKVLKKDDLVASKQKNEERYLLGLRVEGKKIAILVDTSASMTNEKLIDIIKTKSGSNKGKQRAKKWRRTKKITRWLLARLPKHSSVLVVAFNEKAKILGHKGWKKANASTVTSILSEINKLTPQGATNLQQGLQLIKKQVPSNLYVITDGLPTKGESRYKSLNPFASCSSLTGNSNIISGACRVKLFTQTLAESAPKNVKTNVILLPLEGDPDAMNLYWRWTAATGGLTLSPASNWP